MKAAGSSLRPIYKFYMIYSNPRMTESCNISRVLRFRFSDVENESNESRISSVLFHKGDMHVCEVEELFEFSECVSVYRPIL